MDPFTRYFTLNQKLLSLGGLWHTQSHKERLLRYCVIGFMSLYSVFGEVCQILTLNLDLQSAVRSLQVFIPAVCVAIIYSTAILNYATLQKIYSYVQQDWQRLKNDTELKIMKKHSRISKLWTVVGGCTTKTIFYSLFAMLYLYVIISILPSVIRIILSTNEVRRDIDHYPIISCIDYFLDRRTYYYPLVIYQITATFVLGTVAVSYYSMYFSFLHHVCAHLSIIKYKIYCPFITTDNKDNDPLVPTDLAHWIIDIIQHLARTKKFMSLMNRTTGKCYLLQAFLSFTGLIMDFLCMFQIPFLLKQGEHRKDVIELLFFIFGTLFLIYIHCYIGQQLMDYSTDVYREACLIPIHKISLKTQKLLLTTLIISVKPYTFSICKIYVVSHELFSSLIRSALSFAMVLSSLQKN